MYVSWINTAATHRLAQGNWSRQEYRYNLLAQGKIQEHKTWILTKLNILYGLGIEVGVGFNTRTFNVVGQHQGLGRIWFRTAACCFSVLSSTSCLCLIVIFNSHGFSVNLNPYYSRGRLNNILAHDWSMVYHYLFNVYLLFLLFSIMCCHCIIMAPLHYCILIAS